MSTVEYKNFFKYSVFRFRYYTFKKYIFKKLYSKYFLRGFFLRYYPFCFFPNYCKSILKEISFPGDKFLPALPIKNKSLNCVLNTSVFTYHLTDSFPEFIVHTDIEKKNALHRWFWLIHEIVDTKTSPSEVYALIEKKCLPWAKRYNDPSDLIAWSPYNISERVVNLSISLAYHQSSCQDFPIFPKYLLSYLECSAKLLIRRIEFKEKFLTSNHVINNVRGIYFFALILKNSNYRVLAKKIFSREIKKYVNDSGAFLEGSSHYHILLMKWLCEMRWAAVRARDVDFSELLSSLIKQMFDYATIFFVKEVGTMNFHFVRFGDLSPDISVEFLLNLHKTPFSPIYESLNFSGAFYTRENVSSQSEYLRLDYEGQTVLMRSQSLYPPEHLGHAHSDSGAIVYYYQGSPVFIDIGRNNYLNNFESTYYKTHQAHNTVDIDHFGIMPLDSYALPKAYVNPNNILVINPDKNNPALHFSTHGFSRIIGDKIFYQRTVLLKGNILEIIDCFEGKKNHQVTLYFHWGVGWKEIAHPRGSVLMRLPESFNAKLELNVLSGNSESPNIETGYHMGSYNNYNEKIDTLVTKITIAGKFPLKLQTRVILNAA